MRKKTAPKKKTNLLSAKVFRRGKAQMMIIFVTLLFGAFLIGAIVTPTHQTSQNSEIPVTVTTTCCESGDGIACQPLEHDTLSYGGVQYGLLRAKVSMVEGNLHLKDSGQKFNNNPIILNSSDTHHVAPGDQVAQILNEACRPNPGDMYFKKMPPDRDMFNRPLTGTKDQLVALIREYCTSIPDDEIIFVCKENCHPADCPAPYTAGQASCYGDEKTVYDVYGKTGQPVPDFIKNCDKSGLSTQTASVTPGQQGAIIPTDTKRANLHLNTFTISQQASQATVPWLSPFCKPAIYLYPTKKTDVSVRLAPQGNLTYTIPQYPPTGWNVTAYPNGEIESENKTYNYLYYETELPDSAYSPPKDGYAIEQKNLKSFLSSLLVKLGLNTKEKEEFVSYWITVLPKSPYYFVGILSQNTLNNISPLAFSPKPDTLIRVTLFFQALDSTRQVSPPLLQTPKRRGFTVVEWGGIFKKDPKHPFSCFM